VLLLLNVYSSVCASVIAECFNQLLWCAMLQSCRIRTTVCGSGWPCSHVDGNDHGRFETGKSLSNSSESIAAVFLPRCMECRRGLAMRILSVRLSVCLSVRHTRGLWQNGRKICPDLYTIWKNI